MVKFLTRKSAFFRVTKGRYVSLPEKDQFMRQICRCMYIYFMIDTFSFVIEQLLFNLQPC